jgi:general secretion pathway protein K
MDHTRSSQGIALVAVLWIVMLLAVVGAAVISETHSEYRATRNVTNQAVANALADAAINRAIADLMESPEHRQWRPDGTIRRFVFEGMPVNLSIQDELGKIDLNYAPDEMLAGLFQSVGLKPYEVAALVDSIGDWRDEDDLRRLYGAEASQYRDAGRSYGPRNGLFQTIDELRLVLGMTDMLFKRLEPALTVYSQNRGVDVETAPREVLRALPRMDDAAIEQIMRARAARAAGGTDQLRGATALSANLAGRAFAIRAAIELANGSNFIREAIVRPTFNPQKPVIVQAWRSRGTD